tara:strand:+ start:104 stop:223 length:120 start_codon:yes stop_codon:yes gene_type:complete
MRRTESIVAADDDPELERGGKFLYVPQCVVDEILIDHAQ